MADTKYAVELTAKTAEFEAGMARASASAAASAKRIENAFGNLRSKLNSSIGNLAVLVGAGFGATAFVGLIKGSIDAADHLNDLSKSTGLTVEDLAGLGFAAQQSGSDLDESAKAVGKLNLKIAAAIAGNEEAAKSFNLVGISVKELKASTTTDVLARLADQFRTFDGDANKAALGTAFFSKSYAGIAPLLDEGGDKLRENIDYVKRFGGDMTKAAQQADEFNDTLAKLKLLNGQFARTLTSELIGPLQTLANLMVENKEKGEGFSQVAADTASIIKGLAVAALYAVEGFSSLGTAIGANAAALVAAISGDFKRAAFIRDEYFADQKKKLEEYAKLRDAILFGNDKASPKTSQGPAGRGKAPSLGSGDADAAGKSRLDGLIKGLEAGIREERDLLKDREQFLQMYYQDDQIDIKSYFATRQEIILGALDKEVAAYNEEIAALQAYAAKANPKDRVDTESKIADVVAKRAKAQNDAAVAGVKNWLDEQKAAETFRSKLEEITLKLLELKGDSVTAAAYGFDLQNRELQKRIDLERQSADEQTRGNAELLQQKLNDLRQVTLQQAGLNSLQNEFGTILDRVGNAQASVAAKREAGTLTELEALSQLSQINVSRISELQRVADAYEAIAAATGDPRALVAAEALRVKIEALGSAGDLVAKKFNDIFVDSFAAALTEAVNGTKSLKDAFRDMERSIVQSINRIAAQNLAESIFGKGGATGGGFGDILSKLFAGSGGGGGFDIGQFLTLLGQGLGFAANGSSYTSGGPYMVGERGPEILVPPRGSRVIPNNMLGKMGGGSNINITVNPPAGMSRQSAQQFAVQVGSDLNRRLKRA